MTTSWIETQQIEAYLKEKIKTADALLFEARVLLDNELADKVMAQQRTYGLIQQFGRRQLKKEIETIHQQLFTQSEYTSFSQKIKRMFK